MKKFIDGFCRYLQVLQGLKRSTISAYRKNVEEFVTWYSERSTGELPTRRDVESYFEWCYYKGNGNHTRHTKQTSLSAFFRYLKYEGEADEDVTADIPKPRLHIARIHKFTKSEVLSFMRACDITREKGLRDMVIFILAAFCGLRSAEICNLTIADIVDDGEDIDISVKGKKDRNRVVYLWKAPGLYVRHYLLARISQGGRPAGPFLVSYRHRKPSINKIDHSALDNLVHYYAERTGIRKAKVTMHMFRATHAFDLRHIRGYDAAAIAERLGHSNIATTDRYMPERGRIHKEYRSLDEYWHEFKNISKGWKHDSTESPSGGKDSVEKG